MRCLGDTLNCSSQSQMAILIVGITRTSKLSKCKSSSDGLGLEATCFLLWCQLFFNTGELPEHLILKGSQKSIFLHTFSIDILSIILANKNRFLNILSEKVIFFFFFGKDLSSNNWWDAAKCFRLTKWTEIKESQ